MFVNTKAFSGFSVDDVPRAKTFYSETLGLKVSEEFGTSWSIRRTTISRRRIPFSTSRWTILNRLLMT
jgi:predicted enzyme related to lactoylglutathione lyase